MLESMLHNIRPKILDATLKKLLVLANWRQGFVHHWTELSTATSDCRFCLYRRLEAFIKLIRIR